MPLVARTPIFPLRVRASRGVPLCVLVTACAACAPLPPRTVTPSSTTSPFTGYSSATYTRDDRWLCRPGLPGNRCIADLSATEILPDLSRRIIPHVAAVDPKVDCFYVYPTVDMGLVSANHTDLADREAIATAALAQIARWSEVCNVFVPLYRQATIGAYLFATPSERNQRLEVAYSDVADAFTHYLGQYNRGRKIVLVGHSQGAEMVVRLVKQFFEDDSVLRKRLLVALPIGRPIEVPRGRQSGGTFATTPVCTADAVTGCVVAFQSLSAGQHANPASWTPAAGNETVCVNPSSVETNERRYFSDVVLPRDLPRVGSLRGIEGITTRFVVVRDLYTGQCRDGEHGYRFLSIGYEPKPGDRRASLLDLSSFVLTTPLGLHNLDLQFAQGDLLALVARKAALSE